MASKLFSCLPSPQVGGQLFTKRLTDTRKTYAGPFINLPASIRTTENNSDGHAFPRNQSPLPRPPTVNVVLFGETGVGKSSVINLIARREIARVSSDVNRCTMHSTYYNISFDNMDFAIFETIGLERSQMGVNGYLKAIEKAYELIIKLSAAGGIHLLLFCTRGGRIATTMQSNYRLFFECLCNKKVPIALIFTGLEGEEEMEDWWRRHQKLIEEYGIRSDGHACITAVQDDTPGEDLKYTVSQRKIREILKTCALKNNAFLLESPSWFARLGKGMRSFIEKRKNPTKKDIMGVLRHRCKLDRDTARKIADMMEKGDAETKEETLEKQIGGSERTEPGPDTARKIPDMMERGYAETKEEIIEKRIGGSEGTKPGPESYVEMSQGKSMATSKSANENMVEPRNRSVQEDDAGGRYIAQEDSARPWLHGNDGEQPGGSKMAEQTRTEGDADLEASEYHSAAWGRRIHQAERNAQPRVNGSGERPRSLEVLQRKPSPTSESVNGNAVEPHYSGWIRWIPEEEQPKDSDMAERTRTESDACESEEASKYYSAIETESPHTTAWGDSADAQPISVVNANQDDRTCPSLGPTNHQYLCYRSGANRRWTIWYTSFAFDGGHVIFEPGYQLTWDPVSK